MSANRRALMARSRSVPRKQLIRRLWCKPKSIPAPSFCHSSSRWPLMWAWWYSATACRRSSSVTWP
ncbi:hypothetical protein TYRP_022220 [Tyrophagus putrescentiae]|nr:hypothetical protein TYRP_022220 [Tyrophagus putrescentiae]